MTLRHGKPSFMIPGAQKCGTTALAVYLNRHPRLKLATTKEPDFFLRQVRYEGLGPAYYRRLFPKRHPLSRELFFEASVAYLQNPAVPERLARFDPGLRFVVMVREPAGRAYSAWNMYRTLTTVPSERARFEAWLEDHNPADRSAGMAMLEAGVPPFADAVDAELEAIEQSGPNWTLPALVAAGLYAEQLERFLARFARDRFLILEDRDLLERSPDTLNRVLNFLGLPPHDWGDEFPPVLAGDYDARPDRATLERLRAFYAPHNRRFFELAGRSFDW